MEKYICNIYVKIYESFMSALSIPTANCFLFKILFRYNNQQILSVSYGILTPIVGYSCTLDNHQLLRMQTGVFY